MSPSSFAAARCSCPADVPRSDDADLDPSAWQLLGLSSAPDPFRARCSSAQAPATRIARHPTIPKRSPLGRKDSAPHAPTFRARLAPESPRITQFCCETASLSSRSRPRPAAARRLLHVPLQPVHDLLPVIADEIDEERMPVPRRPSLGPPQSLPQHVAILRRHGRVDRPCTISTGWPIRNGAVLLRIPRRLLQVHLRDRTRYSSLPGLTRFPRPRPVKHQVQPLDVRTRWRSPSGSPRPPAPSPSRDRPAHRHRRPDDPAKADARVHHRFARHRGALLLDKRQGRLPRIRDICKELHLTTPPTPLRSTSPWASSSREQHSRHYFAPFDHRAPARIILFAAPAPPAQSPTKVPRSRSPASRAEEARPRSAACTPALPARASPSAIPFGGQAPWPGDRTRNSSASARRRRVRRSITPLDSSPPGRTKPWERPVGPEREKRELAPKSRRIPIPPVPR